MSNNSQAPEAAVLKRKRSRPSDWWQVTPTAPDPPQRDKPPTKKRGSSSTGAKRTVEEAPAAANRGKSRKSVPQEDTENAEIEDEGTAAAKPLRRGRSSNTTAELEAVAATDLAAGRENAHNKKRGRAAPKGKAEEVNQSAKGRRGRGPRSDTSVELETATSSFARNRNPSKKVKNVSKAANAKAKKDSSAAQESSRSRKRRSSNPESQQSISSQPREEKSKGLSKTAAKRNRIEIEGKPM
jgi:hypothetical protein